jgi:hypothetical protein
MVTLQIEHAITDIDTWRSAFDRFAQARRQAGVLAHRVSLPIDDPRHVCVELDFAEAPQAARFAAFLRENVWASPENAPALAGAPQVRILAVVLNSAAS